jgi:hypothetical protein
MSPVPSRLVAVAPRGDPSSKLSLSGALLFLHGGVLRFVNESANHAWVTQNRTRSSAHAQPSLASASLKSLPLFQWSELHGFQI